MAAPVVENAPARVGHFHTGYFDRQTHLPYCNPSSRVWSI